MVEESGNQENEMATQQLDQQMVVGFEQGENVSEEQQLVAEKAKTLVHAFKETSIILDQSVYQEHELMKIQDLLPSDEFIKARNPDNFEGKLACKHRIVDFIVTRQTGFIEYRMNILNIFGSLNQLQTELGVIYKTMEESAYKDEVIQGIIKTRSKALFEKVQQLPGLAQALKDAALEVPKEIANSIAELGIDGKDNLGALIKDLQVLQDQVTDLEVDKTKLVKEKNDEVKDYTIKKSVKTSKLELKIRGYEIAFSGLNQLVKLQREIVKQKEEITQAFNQAIQDFNAKLKEEEEKDLQEKKDRFIQMKKEGESYFKKQFDAMEAEMTTMTTDKKTLERELDDWNKKDFNAELRKNRNDATNVYEAANKAKMDHINALLKRADELEKTPGVRCSRRVKKSSGWFSSKWVTEVWYDYTARDAAVKQAQGVRSQARADRQNYDNGLRIALQPAQQLYDEQMISRSKEIQNCETKLRRCNDEIKRLENKDKEVKEEQKEYKANEQAEFNEESAMKNLLGYQTDRKKRFEEEQTKLKTHKTQACDLKLDKLCKESRQHLQTLCVTYEKLDTPIIISDNETILKQCQAQEESKNGFEPGNGSNVLDEKIQEAKTEIENLTTSHEAAIVDVDKRITKKDEQLKDAQARLAEKEKDAEEKTKDAPLELNQLFTVSSIVSDTNKSIVCGNILNQVLPETCSTMYENFKSALLYFTEDNLLPPLEQKPEQLAILKEQAQEDVDEWSIDTADDQEENNLQVVFRKEILKAAFANKKMAETAAEFLETIALYPISSILEDVARPKDEKEIFIEDYFKFAAASKAKLAVVNRNKIDDLVHGKLIRERKAIIKVGLTPAVNSCREIPNHVILGERLKKVAAEIAEKMKLELEEQQKEQKLAIQQ